MGKQMTYWLFIGMFQGIVDKTKAFRNIYEAKKVFHDFTEFEWDKVCSDEETTIELEYSDFAGSTIKELQIEP